MKINLKKTKILSPENIRISVGKQYLKVVDQYNYLGHNREEDELLENMNEKFIRNLYTLHMTRRSA